MATITKYAVFTLIVLVLTGCTAVYQRDFALDASSDVSYEDKRKVLLSFTEFMKSHGYDTISNEDDQRLAAQFQIRDAHSRIMPGSRISEFFAIRLFKTGEMQIQLQRASSYPPDDFSEKYISDFVSATEKYIYESSGAKVKLRVLLNK